MEWTLVEEADGMAGKGKKRRYLNRVMAGLIALLGLGLLAWSQAVAKGIADGLAVCGRVLIPSLFPFMVLSSFIALTDYARILSKPLKPITTKIYKLPPELGIIVLLSLIGGFPVGAKMIATLLEAGKIDKATAERMLCFCVNSGPSFLITAVGVGMFLNQRVGVILFISQTAATLLVGAVVSFRVKPCKMGKGKGGGMKGSDAFVAAVTGASSAMIAMCSFAVLFSGMVAVVNGSGLAGALARILPVGENVVQAIVCGVMEVTTGCLNAVKVGGEGALLLTSACVSFSGLSVIFQIMSCFKECPIGFRKFILSRLGHIPVAAAIALPLYKMFCDGGEAAVFASLSTAPIMIVDNKIIVISLCLLAMCSILVLSSGKIGKN